MRVKLHTVRSEAGASCILDIELMALSIFQPRSCQAMLFRKKATNKLYLTFIYAA